ncbi:lytic polysaccharide monooxygenase [uncultured Algibacter sp.]|uniref:lytic polysaccharide monooxygenase n=1 Tax=uncultured Algibacter sp. TaxID=298659 RepID=UPI00321780B5
MKKTTLKPKIFNKKNHYFQKWFLQILFCTTLSLTPFHTFSHGTVTSPASRVWTCFNEDPESPDSPACQAAVLGWGTQAFYDWNEVARMDANGMHRSIIMDGNLASAGRPEKFGGLDQVRNDWVATPVTPGPFTLTWTITAPHQTLYYEVYITKASWTPNQPLTWDSLELLVRTGPRPAADEDLIDVVLPQRTGKHVLYSIWQRSLTPEAFYSTSDIDFGTEPQPNEAPVGSFTSDNGECGGLDVDFDATDSYDPNGDLLTYTWNFGDGTTAQGVKVSHSYSNVDNATVTLTVNDGEFSNSVEQNIDLIEIEDCVEPICTFNTPTETALPSVNKTYSNIYVLGTGGPNLESVTGFTVNWSLNDNGLYQFAFNLSEAPHYADFKEATQNFNAPSPKITLAGTGLPGLDGAYDATIYGEDFALVGDGYTIYFSNSTSIPACARDSDTLSNKDFKGLTFNMYPNPAKTNVSIQSDADLKDNDIIVLDLSGKIVKSLSVKESSTKIDLDVSRFETGLYIIRISNRSGANKTLNLVVE